MAATSEHWPNLLSEDEMAMMRIPASFIPTQLRLEMSRFLDVRLDVADRDYRYFAERNGLLPLEWQWLDSQKIDGDTSSFCKVLNYLINKHGPSFTVWQVYLTFFEMKSAAVEVLLKSWPAVKNNYFGTGRRTGQENCEGPICTCAVCSHNSFRSRSACLCLDHSCGVGSARSITLEIAEPGYDSANLQGTYSPHFDTNNNVGFSLKGGGTFNPLSFQKPVSTGLHNFSCVNESTDLPWNIIAHVDDDSTAMFQQPATDSWLCREPCCLDIQPPFMTSKQLGDSASDFGQPGAHPGRVDGQPHSMQYHQGCSDPLCGNRVIYIPNHPYNLSHQSGILKMQHYQLFQEPHKLVRDASVTLSPWDREGHETEVKKQHSSLRDAGRLKSAPESLACESKQNLQERDRHQSFPGGKATGGSLQASAELPSSRSTKPPEKAKHFVLIISGDASQNAESCKQVQSFCQALEERAVPHVAVVPAMKSSPIVWLTEKQRKELLEPPNQTLSAFLKKCYAKAKKILIAVSPNFVSYACPYIKGNRAVDETQNIVHRLFKEMYEEHVDDKRETHRLWPVLLARMDTNRQHIPWFLTRALFYYFPQKQGAENVTELLRTEVLRHR